MGIKKKTGIMMIAASTAAVAGVAAVSFAAWSSGSPTLTVSASTGAVEILGFSGGDLAPELNTPLVPYDQDGTEGSVNVLTVEIPAYEYNVNFTVNISYSSEAELTLMYCVDGESTITVNGETDISEWTALSKTAAQMEGTTPVTDKDGTGAPVTVDAQYLHIILVSEHNRDMDKSFTVTVELVKTITTVG